jgi:hypothetical protein
VRTLSGHLVSATALATDRVIKWGEAEQKHYARLPGRVLAIVVADGVILCDGRWSVGRRGPTHRSVRHAITAIVNAGRPEASPAGGHNAA